MLRCKTIEYAFSLVPLKKWQDFLIRFHMMRCPDCQKMLISREEVQGITVQESQCLATEAVWDGFEEKLKEARTENRQLFRPRWNWAYATAVAFVSVSVAIWILISPQFRKSRVEESFSGRFRINYIQIENKPAQTYVYQPQDSFMILVWAQKNTSGE
jgi:hypothetical protein